MGTRLERVTGQLHRVNLLDRAAAAYAALGEAVGAKQRKTGELMFGSMIAAIRREFPIGDPTFLDIAKEVRSNIDVIHARRRGGPMEAIRIEVLRPLDAFNRRLVPAIEHWQTLTFERELLASLVPLARSHPAIALGHRGGMAARAVRMAKSGLLRSVLPRVSEQLSQQQEFNAGVIDALERWANGEEIPELNRLSRLGALEVVTPSALDRWFDLQRLFNRKVVDAVSILRDGRQDLERSYRHWQQRFETAHVAEVISRFEGTSTLPRLRVVIEGDDPRAVAATKQSLAVQPGRWSYDDASAEWVVFIAAGDRLAPHAFAELSLHLAQHPTQHLVYCDSDELNAEGRRSKPFCKPDWSPELALEVDFVAGLVAVHREDAVGKAAPIELALRLHERALPIGHLPSILVHRRCGATAARTPPHVVEEHLARNNESGRVVETTTGQRVVRPVVGSPLVSIIVPFKDRPELLEQLVTSIAAHEPSVPYELVLVSNNSTSPATHRFLETLKGSKYVHTELNVPFNYSAVNNHGVRLAKGELLLFLNNDIQVGGSGWLEELVAHAQRPAIGAVGANLTFPGGRLQHAGVVVGMAGFAAHPFWRANPGEAWTAWGMSTWTRNVSAVTGACLMMRREVFEAIGGFDESIIVSGSDVELCLRVRSKGLRIVNTPHVALTHHESATRRATTIPDMDAWLSYVRFRDLIIKGDPYWNPNLSLTMPDGSLRTDARTAAELAAQLLGWGLPSSKDALEQFVKPPPSAAA